MKIPFMVECFRQQEPSVVLTHGRSVENCCVRISVVGGVQPGWDILYHPTSTVPIGF